MENGLKKLVALLSIVTALAATPAFAGETAYDGRGDLVPMAPFLEVYRDDSATLDIGDVAAESFVSRFHPANAQTIFFGWSRAAYWFKTRIVNRSPVPQSLYIYFTNPWIDDVRMYLADGKGGFALQRGGDHVPIAETAVPGGRIAFRVALLPGEGADAFFRAHSPMDAMTLSFSLLPEAEYQTIERRHTYATLFYLGAVLALLAYNLLLYVSLRDLGYLYYVLYGVALVLLNLSDKGDAQFWFYPGGNWWSDRAIPEWGILAMLLGTAFTIKFLNTREVVPRWHAVLKGMAAFLAGMGLWGLATQDLIHHSRFIVLFSGLYAVLLTVVAVHCLLKGYRAARFFVVAFMFAPLGLWAYLAMVMGLTSYDVVSYHGLELATMLEMVFFSFALGDRIGIIQNDKERAQAEALEHQLRAQQALSRSKSELENEVRERTADLHAELAEREKLEASLRLAKETAEDATRLKDKFVSLVSHDLRGPVAGMRSTADFVGDLLRSGAPVKQVEDLTASIGESADSLLALLDQLLDISRLQSGRIIPVKRTIYPRQLADEKLRWYQQAASQKGIVLENALPQDMRVIADPALYGQVIGNLLANAVKFCKAGGKVRLFSPEGSRNTAAISDTGVGIKPELLPDLFKTEVKTTTFGTAGEVGTGLGLPYSLEIMKAHGGDIRVESSPGEGSTFFVSLTEAAVSLLIVDDQEAHRRMMKALLLTNISAEVVEAESGHQALDELARNVPALIITDVHMPFGGLEFIRVLKNDPRWSHVPVIVATSTGSEEPQGLMRMREEFFRAGADDFVVKPVMEQDFIPRVKRFL